MFGDLWRFESPTIGREFEWLRQRMDEAFRDFGLSDLRAPQGTFPRVNLGSTEDAIQVYLFAPGLRAEDLDVTIENNVLTVRGRRELGDADDGITWYRRERPQGEFVRSVSLPEGLDADAAEATFRNGVVTIRLPKTEALQPRRIEVRAA